MRRSATEALTDEVVILYEPDRPLDARIQSLSSTALMWILPVITGIIGIGFLVGFWQW